MRSPDINAPSPEGIGIPHGQSELHDRAQLITRYIERIAAENKSAGEEAEREMQEYYAEMGSREKADILYKKLMAYTADRQTGAEADPYLVSELKVLSADAATKTLFSETYAEVRVDAKLQRISDLGNLWNETSEDISKKEEEYKHLEQNLHLKRISGQGKISSAESQMQRLAERLQGLERRKQEVETLRGFPEVVENTDAAANFRYETLKEYKRQLERGFVWLPSRKRIHQETVSAILNHRWPVLVGEAGSGKSDQADAAALELTGYPPTEVECESTTGEKQLIKDVSIDSETGGSYEEYGPLMRAFTGYDSSREKTPAYTNGRIVRFDESGRLGPKAYSVIKKARQKKTGEDFYGRPVLPGAASIWTTNPVGPRYPDRHAPDPAMRRELAEIRVSYPEMSSDDPELYEFILSALLDENGHIPVAKAELTPAYEKKEIPVNERETLDDGSIVVAKDILVLDAADTRHGALWRFASAIKALQDSFVYGNAETEKYPDTLLRFAEDADGVITASRQSGEPLTLSTSTVTLGELASWMSGFNERMQKRDENFRVRTLTEWLDFKIRTYLKQADAADKGKIEAIFRYFHFLEGSTPDVASAKPLTPKEIGYLSPRVPRPVYLEHPIRKGAEIETRQPDKAERYDAKEVLLESGKRVLVDVRDFTGGDGDSVQVRLGEKFTVNGKKFIFSGVVQDPSNQYHGQPIGKFEGEDLYRVFTSEEVDMGMLLEFQSSLENDLSETELEISDFCEIEGQASTPVPQSKKKGGLFGRK